MKNKQYEYFERVFDNYKNLFLSWYISSDYPINEPPPKKNNHIRAVDRLCVITKACWYTNDIQPTQHINQLRPLCPDCGMAMRLDTQFQNPAYKWLCRRTESCSGFWSDTELRLFYIGDGEE